MSVGRDVTWMKTNGPGKRDAHTFFSSSRPVDRRKTGALGEQENLYETGEIMFVGAYDAGKEDE